MSSPLAPTPDTTWLLVSTRPVSSRITPEPSASPTCELTEMATTLGSTAAATGVQLTLDPAVCWTGPEPVPAAGLPDEAFAPALVLAVAAVERTPSLPTTTAVVPAATTAATTADRAMSTYRRRGRSPPSRRANAEPAGGAGGGP